MFRVGCKVECYIKASQSQVKVKIDGRRCGGETMLPDSAAHFLLASSSERNLCFTALNDDASMSFVVYSLIVSSVWTMSTETYWVSIYFMPRLLNMLNQLTILQTQQQKLTIIKQMMSWSFTCLKIFPQVNTTHHWRKVYLCKVVLNHPCFNTTSEYSNLPHHILLFIFPICNLTRTVKLTERNQKLSWDCFELKKYKTILQIASEIEFDKM